MLVQGTNVRNSLLNSLPPAGFECLRSHLRPVLFRRNSLLEEQSRQIDNVAFIETGLVSLRRKSDGRVIEIALVDNHGMLGISALLDTGSADLQSIAVTPGMMLSIQLSDLSRVMEEHRCVRTSLLCGVQALLVHTSQVALCALSHNVTQRVSGWLYRASQAVGGMELPVSHEYVASMLGLRRASVTLTLTRLECEGLITKARGALRVRDRDRLKEVACLCCSTIALRAPAVAKAGQVGQYSSARSSGLQPGLRSILNSHPAKP